MSNRKSRRLALALAVAMLGSALAVPVSAAEVEKTLPQRSNVSMDAASPEVGAGEKESADAASAAISREQAEKLFRQYVNIPDDYALQSTNYGTRRLVKGARPVWSMEFVKRVNGKHVGSINASMDANSGQLLNFNAYSDNPNAKPTYPLKVDREAAQLIAKGLIEQIASDYASQVSFNESVGAQLLPPLTGEVQHSLRYDRLVDGIPYVENYIAIAINSEGHLLSFRLNWDDSIVFPKVERKLTFQEAGVKMSAAAEPVLKYIAAYSTQGKREPMLSYELASFAIDAVTGEKLKEPEYQYYRRGGTLSETPLAEGPLGTAPRQAVTTEKQARDIVEAAFALPTNSVFQSSNFSEYTDDATGDIRAVWHLNWSIKKDGKDIGSASASLNGLTGAIQSFYQYTYGAGAEEATTGAGATLEGAVDRAVETVKKQLPWLVDKLYLIQPNPDQYKDRTPSEIGDYYIEFAHKVNGAIVDYDRVSVAVNARTGEVRQFDASIAPFSYLNRASATIDAEEAVRLWMEYYNLNLTYRITNEYWWGGQPIPLEKYNVLVAAGEIRGDEVEAETKVDLIYHLVPKPVQESVFLDAVTGEWRSRETGEKTSLEIPRATDAEGHWAEDSLQLMVAYKAIDLDAEGKVHPNQGITRGELIKMLVLASSGGRMHGYESLSMGNTAAKTASFSDVAADSAYFAYVESALQQNLIDLGDGSFNPDAPVSRDEMSELIVRALGYNTLANYDYIFKLGFKDAGEIQYKGQAAIVVGLKIMSLTDGKFLPEKKVTRAEASIAFFRYLQKRSELQEAPLRM